MRINGMPRMDYIEIAKKHYEEKVSIKRLSKQGYGTDSCIHRYLTRLKNSEELSYPFPDGITNEDIRRCLYKDREQCDWTEAFQHLKAFHEQYGHTKVRSTYVCKDGFPLGAWFHAQKHNVRKYEGKGVWEYRKEAMEALGVCFDLEKRWEYGLERYKEYVKETGKCTVPANYVCADGYQLGHWYCATKAYCFKKKEKWKNDRCTRQHKDERIGKLKEANFACNTWEAGILHLKKYMQENPGQKIPEKYVCLDGFELGEWLYTIAKRLQYTKGTALIRLDRVEQLKALGLNTDDNLTDVTCTDYSVRDKRWEYGYKKIREYAEKYKTTYVRGDYVTEDGFPLGVWLHHQRCGMRQVESGMEINERQKKKYKLLTDLGVSSKKYQQYNGVNSEAEREINLIEGYWNIGLEKLREYVTKSKTAVMRTTYVTEDGFPLGIWLVSQRKKMRDYEMNGCNPEDKRMSRRYEALRSLGVTSDSHQSRVLF